MNKRISLFIFLFILFFNTGAHAQFDTTFYKKYTDMFGIGIFQATRNNPIVFEKQGTDIPAGLNTVSYDINGKAISGFVIDYDKIYFALGFKTDKKDNDLRKGASNFSNFVLQVGTNKFVIEGGLKKYKGFYDLRTPNFIAPFTDTTLFYQNKSLVNTSFKVKALYFINNKKFSYNSAYFGSYRQVKSAASWVVSANFFSNNTTCDTSLIPPYARVYFGNYAYLQSIKSKGFSVGGGGSGNLVISKSFFINLTFTLQAEPQWRTYTHYQSGETNPFYISLASDIRASMGFNTKRFFFLLTAINDLSFNNSKSIKISDNFFASAVAIGYRFHFENKATRWIKENKIYKWI